MFFWGWSWAAAAFNGFTMLANVAWVDWGASGVSLFAFALNAAVGLHFYRELFKNPKVGWSTRFYDKDGKRVVK